MTKTVSGNSGGGTFRIDAMAGEIGLMRRGIIVATKEKRVYDWLAMAFIEDCFFGERTLDELNRIHRQYPKLRRGHRECGRCPITPY
jgi:hypothetical protein